MSAAPDPTRGRGRPRKHPPRPTTPGPHGGARPGSGRKPGGSLEDGERITVRVPGALLARVDALATSSGRGRSAVLRMAIDAGATLYEGASAGADPITPAAPRPTLPQP